MKRYIKADITSIHDESEDFKKKLARADYASIRMLLRLASDPDEYVREELARRRDLPVEVQEVLINDPLDCVKSALAINPDISIPTMEALSKDKSWRVVMSLGFNRNLPWYLIRELAGITPASIAQNPSTPADLLQKLSVHEDYAVRRYVIYNPSTPLAVLQNMYMYDSDPNIREIARNVYTNVR